MPGKGIERVPDPDVLAKLLEIEPDVQSRIQLMVDFMATRRRFSTILSRRADAGFAV